MKLSDMNLKPRDVVRSSDGRVAEYDGTTFHFTVGQPKVISRGALIDDEKLCEHDWQLLTAQPTLGEAVDLDYLQPDTDYWIMTDGQLRHAFTSPLDEYGELFIYFRDKRLEEGEWDDTTKVYVATLPAFPREKTLRENLESAISDLIAVKESSPVHARDDHSQNCKVCSALKSARAAISLLKGADHE